MLQDSYINEAYIAPIRSVILVDERFLTVGDMCDALHNKIVVDPSLELDREMELWKASRDRKWACDVVTNSDVKAELLQGSDLIVLDYHLRGDDNADDSIRIIQQLACSPRSNLVIVYTKESDLVGAKHRIAATLRGVRSIADRGLEAYIDDNEDGFSRVVSVEAVGKFLRGDASYHEEAAITEFFKGLEVGSTNHYNPAEVIDGLFDSYIREKYRVVPASSTNKTMMSSLRTGPEWVQSGNVFVTLVQKTTHKGDDVFEQLEKALKDWDPPLLVASLAMARRLISEGGFALDSSFLERDPDLHVGWLVHALTSDDPQAPPSKDSLRQLFARALSQTHDTVLDGLAEYASVMAAQGVGTTLMQRARALARELTKPGEKDEAVYLALNGYMCSEPSRGTHVTTGTVFKLGTVDDSEDLYWVCVTPACDMAPRPNKITELGEFRAMTVVRVRKVPERQDGLKKATDMNHLFVVDRASKYKDVLVFEILPLRIETMYAKRLAKLEESSFTVAWVRSEALKELVANDLTQVESGAEGTPPKRKISIEQRMVVVGQLREAYASRLMQVAGGHSSRIGIDFVNFDASKKGSKHK